ncbi:MAG: hypothetical protein H5T86_10065, partial [Armatimonadetes bacterium]|nr:hypothetical protein [Armatimonadota bacterium]
YADASRITGWLRDAAGENPALKTADDFLPLFRALVRHYRYIWIYVAGASSMNPLREETIRPLYRVLEKAVGP